MPSFLPTKIFSRYNRASLEVPDLTKFQKDSFNWFINQGIREVFNELTPIFDYTGKEMKLEFLDYQLGEPKFSEEQAKEKEQNFEAPFRVKLKLTNLVEGIEREQEAYLGEIPILTPRSTFIINGIEKVVISQISRSPGVYFDFVNYHGRKLFGAKIIPYRGAWLELESDSDGAIGVKIDKKRKIAITALLKVFGLETNEDIKKIFDSEHEEKYIAATFKKDPAELREEAYIEICKRLRPGELPTFDSARDLINNMFFRLDRYDLSKIGRYKINQRLNLNTSITQRTLTLEDLISIVKEIIRLNEDFEAVGDDIDHLGNRRVKAVGESLLDRFRVGLMRMRRTIQDRMASLDSRTLTPAQLINPRQLTGALKEFFNVSQLCQFMDQVNMLSELEHKRKITPIGPGGITPERAGIEVRDIHPSHYSRICPIQTPEGKNIGLVLNLALYTRLNELGFLEAPYFKVKDCRLTPEIIWLDAFEELKHKIAHYGVELDETGRIKKDWVEARVLGEPTLVRREDIDLMDISNQQIISAAVALVPFLEHDESNRVLMGANMERQAVPCVRPDPPLVSTGLEEKIAQNSGQCIISSEEGVVEKVDGREIIIATKNGEKKKYELTLFERSNKNTCLLQRPTVNKGDKIKVGDILADGSNSRDGVLALGQNLLVAFIPFYGYNHLDAIVISERVLKQDYFTSVYLEEFSCNVVDTKLGPEVTTYDIPNVSDEKLKNLDEEGIIRLGAEVEAGDILVGKISPKGKAELTPEERLLQAIFGEGIKDVKDTSLVLEPSRKGRVVKIKVLSREKGDKLDIGVIKKITVRIAELRSLQRGDKLAGRHGNKGVVSIIVPEEDMPYLADGRPVDVVLNPLGVASRMNLGQIFEMHLGFAAQKLGYRAIVPALDGPTPEAIQEELIKAGLPRDGKMVLYNGKTGAPFDREIGVGVMYLMKLEHMVEDKIHMRAVGPYSLITQQPLGGRAHYGGQKFGEMEVWALEGYGAAYTLQEMLTIKSDDVLGRANTYEAIVRGETIKSPNIPATFNVILRELQALGLSITMIRRTNSQFSNSVAEDLEE